MSPPKRGRESSHPSRPCDHQQRAVLYLRDSPRPVSPVSARLRAFVALLRAGWHPCPSGDVKHGVAPLWADCAVRRFWPAPKAHFADPKRPRKGFQGQPRGPDQGNAEGSIFELDKAVLSPPYTPSRNAGREHGFTELSTALSYLFAMSRCHHFLDNVIKSAINRAETAVVVAVFRFQKCYQIHF